MGTRSFGKGSVQTIIPLGGNGAVRLTDGALLHARRPLDPGQGHRSRPRDPAGRSRTSSRARTRPRARRACAATSRTTRKRRAAPRLRPAGSDQGQAARRGLRAPARSAPGCRRHPGADQGPQLIGAAWRRPATPSPAEGVFICREPRASGDPRSSSTKP
jgi:hypothetical protein